MEESMQKICYSKSHYKQRATNYCIKCKKYLCETCSTTHCEKNQYHNLLSVDDDLNLQFTGFCAEGHHKNKLDYYCYTHNNLCCAACLCKIKDKGDGQHTECKACHIQEIKDEKKNILENNIKLLKSLLTKTNRMTKDIKKIYEKISPKKEEIKNYIIKIFDKFRKLLDIREKELMKELDAIYSTNFFDDEFIEEFSKFPTKIKYNLEKGNKIIEKWKKYENTGDLNKLIGESIFIEKKVEEFQNISNKIKSISSSSHIQFVTQENDLELIQEKIKNFGKILFYNYKFNFKKCPLDINDKRKFIISGKKENIITKTGPNFVWTGTTCLQEFQNYMEYKWKIRILKSHANQIMIGVAPSDFSVDKIDINDFTLNILGWYFYCYDMMLYSGPPHNYRNKTTDFKPFYNEIIMVMNMNKRTLKFIVNNIDKGPQYENIPIDKPLFPVVCLFNPDTVEICEI